MRKAPLAVAVLSLVAAPQAQKCASGPPTKLGTVRVLSTTCGTGSLPRTTCRLLRIACDGIPAIDVQVRVTEPDARAGLRGTVVLGTGGGGTGYYVDRTGGRELVQALLQRGFRVVDRAWRGGGWFASRTSIRKQSCRYATLLTWVHQKVHTKGAFCATGNSGGSAELCYALTTWGRGAILDVAVPTGGPPMARLDYLCMNPASQQWLALCRSITPNLSDCTRPSCTIGRAHAVCTGCSSNATAADLHADSILHPGATLSFPRTRVHQIIGARDCGSAFPNGMLFHRAVTSERVIEFPAGTPHWTAGTLAGRRAIERALLAGAACPSGPASIAVAAFPRPGENLEIDLHGPSGRAWILFLGVGSGAVEVPPLGWWFLELPFFHVGAGVLNGTTGRARFVLPVPRDRRLSGVRLLDQALAGSCLSNLLGVRIL